MIINPALVHIIELEARRRTLWSQSRVDRAQAEALTEALYAAWATRRREIAGRRGNDTLRDACPTCGKRITMRGSARHVCRRLR